MGHRMENNTSLTVTQKRGSLLEVTSDVACLQDRIVNLYFFGEPNAGDGGWTLVDTGLFGAAGRIRRAVAERFGTGSRPRRSSLRMDISITLVR